ncbi:MAG: capsular biosynthesis protein [Proteobacteria bacterium]|nr:capsular biosynthesis protein [Pseudomonadota bacterium]
MTQPAANRIVIDLDGTLTHDDPALPYPERRPRLDVIARLRDYRAMGYTICILTARNMRTYEGNVGKIAVHTLPVIAAWLERHEVPHDEILVGKPWCGPQGFYVDDRALRPDEFVRLAPDEVERLIGENADK